MLGFSEVSGIWPSAAPSRPYLPPTVYVPPASLGGPKAEPGGPPLRAPQYILVRCTGDVAIGCAVVAYGEGGVALADASSPSPVVGLVTAKQAPTRAVVQTSGEVVLGLAGLSPGASYFVGPGGRLVAPPLGGIEFVQRVGTATSDTTLFLSLDGMVTRQELVP